MSEEPLPPLGDELRALLERAGVPRPADSVRRRMLERLQAAVPPAGTGGPMSAGPAAAMRAPLLGSLGLPLAGAMLALGAVGGFASASWLNRPEQAQPGAAARPFPLAEPPPGGVPSPATGVERPPATALSPASSPEQRPARTPPTAPLRPQPRPAPPPSVRDVSLSDERALVEIARSALSRGDTAGGLRAIEQHALRFAKGQLAEERNALRVQALVDAGRLEEARHHIREFAASYPTSLLRPAVEAMLPPPH